MYTCTVVYTLYTNVHGKNDSHMHAARSVLQTHVQIHKGCLVKICVQCSTVHVHVYVECHDML